MKSSTGFLFEVYEELTEGPLVSLQVTTPDGRRIQLWSEVELQASALVLRQFAIYGVDVVAKGLGAQVLRDMAQALMEVFDVGTIRIEEARRTSGVNPGRTARTLEFHRRALDAGTPDRG